MENVWLPSHALERFKYKFNKPAAYTTWILSHALKSAVFELHATGDNLNEGSGRDVCVFTSCDDGVHIRYT